MKSEREKLYEKIEAIGGMEELEKMVARKKPYGGYEAMVESNAEYFSRVRAEEVQRQNLEVKCATCHMHGATHGELCEWCHADAEKRKLRDNAQAQDYKQDAGKVRLSLVPVSGIEAVARVREYGVSKYHTEQGWDKVEIRRYVDALGRHFMEFLKDNNGVDSESGLPHMEHVCCNAFFIIELMRRGDNAQV